MPIDKDTAFRNRLLVGLSIDDRALLQPHLCLVDLPLRKQIESRSRRFDYSYFIQTGMASVVAYGLDEKSLEVGLIGHEGMTGVSAVLATGQSPHETYMQSAGSGWRIGTEELRGCIRTSETLHQTLMKYAFSLFMQSTFTAFVNGRCKMEDRLARWLLMAHDRAESDDLALTHEFLAVTLGVRRPGITNAMNTFQKRGLISTRRGIISVLDRANLEAAAHGAYGGPELEYQRLFHTDFRQVPVI